MATTPQVQVGATAGGNPPVGYAQGVSNPPDGGAVTSVDPPQPMVPMLSPDGKSGDIPANRVQDALKAGFKAAYAMTSPDGQTGYVPQDQYQNAAAKGFKLNTQPGVRVVGTNGAGQPIFGPDAQPSTASLYAQALFNPVGSGAASGVSGGLEQFGGRAMQGLTAPLLHPIDTLEGIAHTIAHPIDTAEQRIDEFKQEWKRNPALALENAAGDVAGAVEGGRLGGAAAEKIVPVALKGAGRAALLGKTPEEAYESALKPSTTLDPAERGNIVQSGIENSIPVSKGGLEKLQGLIAKADQARQDVINSDPTRPISPIPALRNLQSVRSKFATQVNPTADVQAVDSAGQEFANQLSNGQPGPNPQRNLTAAEAQAMKTGTYRALGNKAYGELKGASVEAQKSLARGLKDELAAQFPELKNLNAQESKMLDLQPVLERAVGRIGNHQIVGIGTPIAGAAGKALTGSTSAGLVVGALKAVLDNPYVKSRLAIAISKGGKVPFAQAAAKVAAYSSALGSYAGSTASNTQPSSPQP